MGCNVNNRRQGPEIAFWKPSVLTTAISGNDGRFQANAARTTSAPYNRPHMNQVRSPGRPEIYMFVNPPHEGQGQQCGVPCAGHSNTNERCARRKHWEMLFTQLRYYGYGWPWPWGQRHERELIIKQVFRLLQTNLQFPFKINTKQIMYGCCEILRMHVCGSNSTFQF